VEATPRPAEAAAVGFGVDRAGLAAADVAGLAGALLILGTAWEDRLLQANLAGYAEYAGPVCFRILPGLW
jgi:hypothetical protein